jgi:hypothetical protein
MCTIGNHLKLCTCTSTIDLKQSNFWVLKKGMPPTDAVSAVLGSVMMPNDENISKSDDNYNIQQLTQLLNSNYCFDQDMMLQNGDTVTLNFHEKLSEDLDGPIKYSFSYTNGKWEFDKWVDAFNYSPKKGTGKIELI